MSEPIYYWAEGDDFDPWQLEFRPGRVFPDVQWYRVQSPPVLRDANATAGTWPEVITLPYMTVTATERWPQGIPFWAPPEDRFAEGLEVPNICWFDPERAVWRRRKWWGRGPIKPLGGCWNPWPESRICMEALPCVWPRCKPREGVEPVGWRN